MDTSEKIKDALDAASASYTRKLKSLLAHCESPIEKLFLANFFNCFNDTPPYSVEFIIDWLPHNDEYGIILTQFKAPMRVVGLRYFTPDISYEIFPQHELEIKEQILRLDFAIFFSRNNLPGARNSHTARICIECDGHDFHEKTKEQAIKDNSRRRLLEEKGWRVINYSGAEIYRNGNFQDFSQLLFQIQRIAHAEWKIE